MILYKRICLQMIRSLQPMFNQATGISMLCDFNTLMAFDQLAQLCRQYGAVPVIATRDTAAKLKEQKGTAPKEQQLYPATTSAAACALHSCGFAPGDASVVTGAAQTHVSSYGRLHWLPWTTLAAVNTRPGNPGCTHHWIAPA